MGKAGSTAIAVLSIPGKLSPKELVAEARKCASALGCFTQVFDPQAIASALQLEIALENAKKAFKQNENVSDSLENEFLLRAAGTHKFDLALSRIGVRESSAVLIFCDDEKKLEQIAQKLGATAKEFVPTLTIERAQKIYSLEKEIFSTLTLEQAVIEKIALFFD